MFSCKAHDLNKKKLTADVYISEKIDFSGFLLSDQILTGLSSAGFKKPSPIQLKAIPLGLCGFDLLVQSKAGTGKTVVFSVIALQSITLDSACPQVLILAPTREIAVQIQQVLNTLACGFKDIKAEYFIGGLPVDEDKAKLQTSKIHLAIGAPGRVKELVKTGHLPTKNIKLLVLDEADKLVQGVFKDDIDFIISKLPANRQIIAASATYPNGIDKIIANYMRVPTKITVHSDIPTLLGLKPFVTVVKSHLNIAKQLTIKTDELIRILTTVPFKQCIVFTNYQTRAESLSNNLNNMGWPSHYLSANQIQKERLQTMNDFKNHKFRLLISTDLSARGIDTDSVNLVVNFDVPYDPATYLHRIGRAGRFGSQGLCITICCENDEYDKFKSFLYVINPNMKIGKLPAKDNMPNNIWKCDDSEFENAFDLNLNPVTDRENVFMTNGKDSATLSEDSNANIEHIRSEMDKLNYAELTNSNAEQNSSNLPTEVSDDSDVGEIMPQDLSTTPAAVERKQKEEAIRNRNIALLQLSKLLAYKVQRKSTLDLKSFAQIEESLLQKENCNRETKQSQENGSEKSANQEENHEKNLQLNTDKQDVRKIDANFKDIVLHVAFLKNLIAEEKLTLVEHKENFKRISYVTIAKKLLTGEASELDKLKQKQVTIIESKAMINSQDSDKEEDMKRKTNKGKKKKEISESSYSDPMQFVSSRYPSNEEFPRWESVPTYTCENVPVCGSSFHSDNVNGEHLNAHSVGTNGCQYCGCSCRTKLYANCFNYYQSWYEEWLNQSMHIRQHVQQTAFMHHMQNVYHSGYFPN